MLNQMRPNIKEIVLKYLDPAALPTPEAMPTPTATATAPPPMPMPTNQNPPSSNTRRTWARPSDKPGRIKFGDFSIEVDQNHYTDYATDIDTSPQNPNDGWEHCLRCFEALPKAMVDLEYVHTFPNDSVNIALGTHFNVVQDWQFVLDAVNMVDNIACRAEQAYCAPLQSPERRTSSVNRSPTRWLTISWRTLNSQPH
jgi:hypothetical protein